MVDFAPLSVEIIQGIFTVFRENISKNLMLSLIKNVRADPNIPDLNGNYPLHLAISNKPKVNELLTANVWCLHARLKIYLNYIV